MPRCPEFKIECDNAVFANENQEKAPGCLMKNTLECPPFVNELRRELIEIGWSSKEIEGGLEVQGRNMKWKLRWKGGE